MIKHRHQRKLQKVLVTILKQKKSCSRATKEQQKKREDQIKEAIRLKQEQQKTNKKTTLSKRNFTKSKANVPNVQDQLSKAARDYARKSQVLKVIQPINLKSLKMLKRKI